MYINLTSRGERFDIISINSVAGFQVNLRSVGRKRFAHLSENFDEIHVDANVPWGEDTLFTLEFRIDDGGKYALHTCNNKYLSREGKLVDVCNQNCLFSLEYQSGLLALRDHSGAYLSPIGSKALLKTRSQTVTKDELFSLEDSLPQASFIAALNSRYVSVKQGKPFDILFFLSIEKQSKSPCRNKTSAKNKSVRSCSLG